MFAAESILVNLRGLLLRDTWSSLLQLKSLLRN